MFVCNTTKNSLEFGRPAQLKVLTGNMMKILKDTHHVTLGNFTLSRDGANATAVNSTAVLTDPVQLSHDGVTLKCTENSPNLSDYTEVVLSVGKSAKLYISNASTGMICTIMICLNYACADAAADIDHNFIIF